MLAESNLAKRSATQAQMSLCRVPSRQAAGLHLAGSTAELLSGRRAARSVQRRRFDRDNGRSIRSNSNLASTIGSDSDPVRPVKPPIYGQPTHKTHPHLIKPHELTPGIPISEYEARRKKLMSGMPEGSVVICLSGGVKLVTQQKRSSTDFFYLTGFTSPDSALILESRPSSQRGYIYTLYVPGKDSHEELWEGARTGVDVAVDLFGADRAFANTRLRGDVPGILAEVERRGGGTKCYVGLPPAATSSPWGSAYPPSSPNIHGKTKRKSALSKMLSAASGSSNSSIWEPSPSDPPHLILHASLASSTASPLPPLIESQRLIKSHNELDLMSLAGKISGDAHAKVMGMVGRGELKTEAEVAATFEWACAMRGSDRPAYLPVVASGANATVIHYTKNDCKLQDGELMLLDAGCEMSNYASDITRTFPVSGKFTEPQKDLYQAVLNVQKACIKKCTLEDEIGMNELHRFSCTGLAEELKQIGFKLNVGDVERTLYPHYLTHHLGSDLHDCPSLNRNDKLVAGQVITIEPGIYVPPGSSFPKAFHGMGIRIEDDVAFCKDGPWVLSSHAPKEIVDIEGLSQGDESRTANLRHGSGTLLSSSSPRHMSTGSVRRYSTSNKSEALPQAATPAPSSTKNDDVDEFGIPLNPSPLPQALLRPPSVSISRTYLHRLCRLAALNPPEPDSSAEAKLKAKLSSLIGLMEQIKSVDLELENGPDGKPSKEALRKRLLDCLWESEEVVIDGTGMEVQKRASRAKKGKTTETQAAKVVDDNFTQEDAVSGTDLLRWRRPLS